MPERVTREERIVSLAIEKARKAKEELSAKQRKNIEPTQVLEIDTDPEVEKIKRPKVQDASKITNQTQKKEGYGLAGESLKKQDDLRSQAKDFKPEKPLKRHDKKFMVMRTKDMPSHALIAIGYVNLKGKDITVFENPSGLPFVREQDLP